MARKNGDKNYANYVGYQKFSSDEPTHRINNTNWHLKFENNKPGFFIQAENCFKQMPNETFKCTAEFKSKETTMAGYAEQVKNYFNKSMEEIFKCQTEEKAETK